MVSDNNALLRLVLATRNPHKADELASLLKAIASIEPMPADSPPAPTEDGETLEANAIIKAKQALAHTGLPSLADDTGLFVECLGGLPGVHTARYAGEGATASQNNQKLLAALGGSAERAAYFETCIVLMLPDGSTYTFTGRVDGRIAEAITGNGGFGYDPIFIPNGYNQSFAELPIEVKNKIGHRGLAVQKLAAWLKSPEALSLA